MAEQSMEFMQIGISVRDVRATALLLDQLIGPLTWRFEQWDASEAVGMKVQFRGTENRDWKADLAFARLGPIELELIADTAGQSGYGEYATAKGPGLRHLMFMTSSLATTIETMSQQGLTVVNRVTSDDKQYDWAMFDGRSQLGFDIEAKQRIA